LTPLCLFIQTSPTDFAVASRKGNRLFTRKLHVKTANKLRSPQCRNDVQLLPPFRPTSFFVTIYLPLRRDFLETGFSNSLSRFVGGQSLSASYLFRQTLLNHPLFDISRDGSLKEVRSISRGSKLVFVKRDMGPTNEQQRHFNEWPSKPV
jgi:hypothetical protein